jgi:DNA processing protein
LTHLSCFYYKGEIRNITNCLAIVGSRKHTSYGARVTESIAGELAANGFTIISGLALGVDTIAHQAALKAKGRTIAVLGTGLDNQSLYPPANRKLAEDIVANGGAIISEFPLGTEPLRYNFPMRNRIVSGLSLGTVVVEASEKSGSLITATCALEQGREVFAVPGNIFSDFSKGTNNLIKQGAKAVSSAQEIIETFDFQYEARHTALKKAVPASIEEEKIIAIIGCETRHINDIVRLSELDTSRINSTLIIMEMKGMVRNIGGGEYILT